MAVSIRRKMALLVLTFLLSLASTVSFPANVSATAEPSVEITMANPISSTSKEESWSILGIVGVSAIILVSVIVLYAVFLSFSADGRRLLMRLFHLTRRLLGVEVGMRGLIQLVLYSALPAFAVGFQQGYRQGKFDWHIFLTVFLIVTGVGIASNLINQSMQLKRILSPGAGRVWRAERKAATAAIIQRINRHVSHSTASIPEVKKIIQDLLDVIVLHVRDHQGNFRNDRPRVFGNLLIEDGAELVVIARDSISHSSQYQRPIPMRYPKETLLCGRAIAARKVLSVSDLIYSYPEGPKTKPYRSILAIPLFGGQGDAPYGALSVDCSQPYFFDSFVPGKVENDLENSLQPYAHLITLTLEALVSTDRSVMISKVAQAVVPPQSQGGHP